MIVNSRSINDVTVAEILCTHTVQCILGYLNLDYPNPRLSEPHFNDMHGYSDAHYIELYFIPIENILFHLSELFT